MSEIRQGPPANIGEIRWEISQRKKLPKQVTHVLQAALDRPDLVAFGTSQSLALATGVAQTTVIRATRSLGYRKFSDFRDAFRESLRRQQASFLIRTDTAGTRH